MASRNHRVSQWTAFVLILMGTASSAEVLHLWEFGDGPNGWTANANLVSSGFSDEGWELESIAEDPFLVGPSVAYPHSRLLRVSLRMRSEADSQGKLFWGETFSEEQSREFAVEPDGEWREYEIHLDSLYPQARLRLDPCHLAGKIELAWIRVESVSNPVLDNGTVRVQLDLGAGGAIAHLSQSGSNRNLINLHDRGRYVQQSYYAGQRIDRQAEGQAPHWSPWPWNPIQVGDAYGYSSPVLEAWVRDGTAYTKCQPLLWDMRDEKAQCHMEMWVSLNEGTVHVKNRLTCFRTDNRWNLTQSHQELPAVYTIGDLHRLFTYVGGAPWSAGDPTRIVNSGPPWEYWENPEHWAALLDSNGFGVGIYNPTATLFIGGFHGSAGGGAHDSSTGYYAPLRTEALGKETVYDYEYDLVVGSIHDIRHFVYEKEGKVYTGGPTSTPTFTPTITHTPSLTPTDTPTPSPTATETPTSTPSFTPTSTRLSPNFHLDSTIDSLDLLEFLRRWRYDRSVATVDLDGNDLVDGRDPLVVGLHWKETTGPSGNRSPG